MKTEKEVREKLEELKRKCKVLELIISKSDNQLWELEFHKNIIAFIEWFLYEVEKEPSYNKTDIKIN